MTLPVTTKRRVRKVPDGFLMTTIELPRELYQRARLQAVREHRPVRALIEESIRTYLTRKEDTR